jgi:methionyl aminopeptidase
VAKTYVVGDVDVEALRLLEVTEGALYDGIDEAREGNRLFDISNAIQRRVEGAGFSVVRDFVGHGIGRNLHEDPQIPNWGEKGRGVRLRKGMVLAIEPMVNSGGYEVFVAENGWTAMTRDGSLSAHFEHTVAVTENGPEILSRL